MLSHGWINLSPISRLNNGFIYPIHLDENRPITITIKATRNGVEILTDTALRIDDKNLLLNRITRILSLDFPLGSFRKTCIERGRSNFYRLARKGWGRILRSGSPWEDAAKTLLTTNASWPHTVKMCDALVQHIGKVAPSGVKAFPTSQQLIKYNRIHSLDKLKLGYRGSYLIALAENAIGEDSWLQEPQISIGKEELEKRVSKWKGFGPYATNHLMMLMGFHSYLPIDREVIKHMKTNIDLKRARNDSITDFSDWGDFRFTAYKLSRVAKKMNWIGD